MENSNKTKLFSEVGLKSSFASIFEKSECFVISNINLNFQNQRRFTLFVSNDLIQFIEKKVSGETYSWGKYWDQDQIYMNKTKYEKETIIPFFGMLETCIYQIMGKDAAVFFLNESSETVSVPKKHEDIQNIVFQDLVELPFSVNMDFKLEVRFQMLQKVSYSLRKAKSFLVDRPISFSEITDEPAPLNGRMNTPSSLESMGIQMLGGLRNDNGVGTDESLKILEEKPVLFNQLVGPNKEEIVSLFSERVLEEGVSLSNFLNLIKTLYLSWPKVNDDVHLCVKTCIESLCKNSDSSVIVQDLFEGGWMIPQALNSFSLDYIPLFENLLKKNKLNESEKEFVSLLANYILRSEDVTIVSEQVMNALYLSEHIEDSVKFRPWKKGFLHGFTLSVRKSTLLSKLLNKNTLDSFDDLSENKKKVIEILKAMLFLVEKGVIEKMSLRGFENYIFNIDKMSLGHLDETLTLSEFYSENSMTDFAKYYANQFDRIVAEYF
ncbi:hypothetical protein HOG98_03280 [bacterium]|jgi:hypothetical protein|nr:hypothetical protein [bacterium]